LLHRIRQPRSHIQWGEMGDRYFPNTLSDYVVDINEDANDVQAEAGKSPEASFSDSNVMLKAAIALKDEVIKSYPYQLSLRDGFAPSLDH
jgi:hypothetical protein